MYGPRTKRYEFETRDQWRACKFLEVLNVLNVLTNDMDICMPSEGLNYISFWCTDKKRKQIEYIYRRYVRLDKIFINPDKYLANCEKMHTDGYMIC